MVGLIKMIIKIIFNVGVFIFLRAKKFLILGLPISIILALVAALIPCASTIIFSILKAKGLLALSWWWIIAPIVFDFFDLMSVIGFFSDAIDEANQAVEEHKAGSTESASSRYQDLFHINSLDNNFESGSNNGTDSDKYNRTK